MKPSLLLILFALCAGCGESQNDLLKEFIELCPSDVTMKIEVSYWSRSASAECVFPKEVSDGVD